MSKIKNRKEIICVPSAIFFAILYHKNTFKKKWEWVDFIQNKNKIKIFKILSKNTKNIHKYTKENKNEIKLNVTKSRAL